MYKAIAIFSHLKMTSLQSLFSVVILVFWPGITKSQGYRVPPRIWAMSSGSIVYLESIHKSTGAFSTDVDTVSGVGFLLIDNGLTYLVTANNNLLKKSFNGATKQNDSIYLSKSPDGNRKGVYLTGLLSDLGPKGNVYTLEKGNLLIVKLTRKHETALKYLSKESAKPIPVKDIQNTTKSQKAGDTVFHGVYLSYRDQDGKRKLRTGVGMSLVTSSSNAESFQVNYLPIQHGNGAPVMSNGKLVGMVIETDERRQVRVVLKSTYIVSALRTLQQQELSLKRLPISFPKR
jgi:CBS domain-containing protein